jgi:hypothetical protein
MSAKIASLIVAFFAVAPLAAQTSAPAYIVTRLGNDTVAVERFTRSSNKLEGDLLLKYPRVRTIHYAADLGAKGEIKSISTTVRRAGTDPNAMPAMQIDTRFADTVAVIDVQRNGQPDTSVSGKKSYRGSVAPMLGVEPTSYGIYEQLLSSANLGRDTVSYALVAPGPGPTPAIILRRRGPDSVAFTSTFFPGWTEVARVDARATRSRRQKQATQKVKKNRHSSPLKMGENPVAVEVRSRLIGAAQPLIKNVRFQPLVRYRRHQISEKKSQ